MKACVCLLEVSRHGLLETELLALLAEEKNIKVPEYAPDDEKLNELMNKSNTVESNAAQLNITATIDNIAKRVQDTYVNEESTAKNPGQSKPEPKPEKKKGNYFNKVVIVISSVIE